MSERPARPRLVMLTPVYNEAANLDAYAQAVRAAILSRTDLDARVVLIDDGSVDDSWNRIVDLARRDGSFTGIRLSRNYGSHVALSAGFANIGDADVAATLACDLQDPPEVVVEMVAAWRAGADIVWGKRKSRADAAARVWGSRLFERLIRAHAMPRGSKFVTGSFLLVDRAVADCFNSFREHHRVTFALVAWTGFSQATVEYHRAPRRGGASGWTYRAMLNALGDVVIAFSPLPGRIMIRMAALLGALTMAYAIVLGVRAATDAAVPGWTIVLLAVCALFTLQFAFMGILGEYLRRIYTQVAMRPLYFIATRTAPEADVDAGRGGAGGSTPAADRRSSPLA